MIRGITMGECKECLKEVTSGQSFKLMKGISQLGAEYPTTDIVMSFCNPANNQPIWLPRGSKLKIIQGKGLLHEFPAGKVLEVTPHIGVGSAGYDIGGVMGIKDSETGEIIPMSVLYDLEEITVEVL